MGSTRYDTLVLSWSASRAWQGRRFRGFDSKRARYGLDEIVDLRVSNNQSISVPDQLSAKLNRSKKVADGLVAPTRELR